MIHEWAGALTMEGKAGFVRFLSASSLIPSPPLPFPLWGYFCGLHSLAKWTPKPNWGEGKGVRGEVSQSFTRRFNPLALSGKYGVYVGQRSLQICIIYGHFYKYRTSHGRFTRRRAACKVNRVYPCYGLGEESAGWQLKMEVKVGERCMQRRSCHKARHFLVWESTALTLLRGQGFQSAPLYLVPEGFFVFLPLCVPVACMCMKCTCRWFSMQNWDQGQLGRWEHRWLQKKLSAAALPCSSGQNSSLPRLLPVRPTW